MHWTRDPTKHAQSIIPHIKREKVSLVANNNVQPRLASNLLRTLAKNLSYAPECASIGSNSSDYWGKTREMNRPRLQDAKRVQMQGIVTWWHNTLPTEHLACRTRYVYAPEYKHEHATSLSVQYMLPCTSTTSREPNLSTHIFGIGYPSGGSQKIYSVSVSHPRLTCCTCTGSSTIHAVNTGMHERQLGWVSNSRPNDFAHWVESRSE